MNNLFTKIFTFFMALVVFMSGLGLAVSKHYCASELRDIKFFQEADSCLVFQATNCEKNKGINSEPCCKNEHHFFVDATEKVNSSFKLDLNWDFKFDYFNIFHEQIVFVEQDVPIDNFLRKGKPIREFDLFIWNQSFLI